LGKEEVMYRNEDEMERRCLPKAEARIDGGDSPKITGYAAIFDTWADIGGWFKESIRKGAFTKTIRESDVRALWNHNADYVLGRNKAGTLRLWEDSHGLGYEIKPPNTTWANDLIESMRREDISQSSFGFIVNKQEMDYDKDERVLVDVTLFDVSPVCYPAYPTTSAQVRSAFQHKKTSPPPDRPKWEELDRIINKLKSEEELTEEELRTINTHIPGLSVPPAKHTETVEEPPAKHSADDTRTGDRWLHKLEEYEKKYPAIKQTAQGGK
jgi:uncharacterized protein